MRPTKLQERDRKALRKLEKDGRLNKHDVVDAARDPKSALHRHFTWSDKRCGELHRAEEALSLIESYHVQMVIVDQVIDDLPFYVNDPSKTAKDPGHIALPKLQEDRRLGLIALRNEAERVHSALTRARGIAVALGLQSELENMLIDMSSIVQRMRAA